MGSRDDAVGRTIAPTNVPGFESRTRRHKWVSFVVFVADSIAG